MKTDIIGKWRVIGTPKAQPRPRAFARGGRAAVYDPGTAEGWKSSIAMAMRDMEGRRITGPVAIGISFIMPRPKSHFRKNGQLNPKAPQSRHTQKPDIDNLIKAVLDAISNIGAWRDDSQIFSVSSQKMWETDSKPAGCFIEILEITEP